jgi:hypothetical protein
MLLLVKEMILSWDPELEFDCISPCPHLSASEWRMEGKIGGDVPYMHMRY